jgi:hypothetical protein
MNKFVRKDWADFERALSGGKWFDYRFMSPTAATYLFADEFKKAYRSAFAENIDTPSAQFITPLPENLFDAPRSTISGIWRARQVADAMGMPYDIYLSRAYHWTLRYWRRRHLPRPQQLYSNMVTDRTAVDWEEIQTTRMFYSKNVRFTNAKYVGLKVQNDHHEWLLEQLNNRGNRLDQIVELVNQDLLPAEKIRSRLGEGVYADVLQRSNLIPA